jgi:hypothetical protein
VVFARLIAVMDGLLRSGVCGKGLMRGVRMVIVLVVPGRLAMMLCRLIMMLCGGLVMPCAFVKCGHDGSLVATLGWGRVCRTANRKTRRASGLATYQAGH